ncbi:MAG: aminopeptidase [Firmicutes bacterium]|nr:aminopeptidase [Bacillota bacterium]
MQDFILVEDPRRIKAMADEKRIRLLDILVRDQATVGQLASILGEPHAKIYYHVKELERNGFIEMVKESPRSGAAEKYYRAKAKTFLLGLGLGMYSDVETIAKQAAEDDLLKWRRQNVLGVDFRKVAHTVVNETLMIEPGERVLVEGGPHQMEFLEAIVFEVWNAKADAILEVTSDELIARALGELPAKVLEEEPFLKKELYSLIDCRISLDPFPDETVFQNIPEDQFDAWRRREWQALQALRNRTGRTVWIGFPTPALGALTSTDYTKLYDTFWKAMAVSPEELESEAEQHVSRFKVGEELTVRGRGGTEVQFTINEPPRVITRFPRGTREEGWQVGFLPAGEVRLPAKPASAHGTFAPDDFVYAGHPVKNLRLGIEAGKVAAIEATEGEELIKKVIGSKQALFCSALSIGVNPAATRVSGYELLDMVAQGAVTLTLADPNGHLSWRLTTSRATIEQL